MDKYMHHLELLLNQARPIEASSSMETTLTSRQKQSTSPNVIPMEPLVLTPPEELNDHVGKVLWSQTSPSPFDFFATDSQLAFIPNSSLSSTSHGNYPTAISATTAQVEISSMNLSMMTSQSLPQFSHTSLPSIPNKNFYQLAYGCPPQQVSKENLYYFVSGYPPKQHLQEQNNLYHIVDEFPSQKQPSRLNLHLIDGCPSQNYQQQQVPSMGYTNLKNQVSYIDQQILPCIDQQTLPYIDQQTFFSSHSPNPRYLNPTGNPMDSNWEAINAYLLGKVRPGPDIAYIFKCSICSAEFPNAQAFGGHMSSHRKNKKREKIAATKHQFKKANLQSSCSTNIRKAIVWPSSRKSTPLKKVKNEKNDMKDKEKFECESEESVSS